MGSYANGPDNLELTVEITKAALQGFGSVGATLNDSDAKIVAAFMLEIKKALDTMKE